MTNNNNLWHNFKTIKTPEITMDALTSVKGGGLVECLNDAAMSHLLTWVSPGHSGYGLGQAVNGWLTRNIGS
jgi:hypothetical protein